MQADFDLFRERLLSAIGQEPLYTWVVRHGINKGTFNGAMTRRAIPKAEMLIQISRASGKSLDYLLGLSDDAATASRTHPAPKPAEPPAPSEAMLVDEKYLGMAIASVDKALSDRNLSITPEKRAKLTAFIYQEFMRDKAEGHTAAYLSKLMELVFNN